MSKDRKKLSWRRKKEWRSTYSPKDISEELEPDFTPIRQKHITKLDDELLMKGGDWDLDSDEGQLSHINVNKKQMISGATISMMDAAKRILETPLKSAGHIQRARAEELANEMRKIKVIVPDKHVDEFDLLLSRLQYFALS